MLAIIGSPRTNGNTYKTIKLIEQRLIEKDNTVEFEYVQLSKTDMRTCKGCFACVEKGEENCPLKDDRKNLEIKMRKADAVIFASPVYTYNVSWIMKNFLDRFAYRCHRPDFHGKKAMVVVSTGAVGLGVVGCILSFIIGTMGFITCAKVGLTYAPLHEIDNIKSLKEMKKLNKQVDLFYSKINDTEVIKPSFIKLLTFRMQQKAFLKAPQNSADFQFWNAKGWLNKTENYYYKVHVGKVKNSIALLISRILK
jgi:multimeric flavodoxin WrbA